MRDPGAHCSRLKSLRSVLEEAPALVAEETDPVVARKIWAEAVESERKRVKHESILADTVAGRRLQHALGMSSVVANRVVRTAGKRILESVETSKPKQ
jgi:hypothetical protein